MSVAIEVGEVIMKIFWQHLSPEHYRVERVG